MTAEDFPLPVEESGNAAHVPDLPGEEWRDVRGYEGLYQVTFDGLLDGRLDGRVRSLDRRIKQGTRWRSTVAGSLTCINAGR